MIKNEIRNCKPDSQGGEKEKSGKKKKGKERKRKEKEREKNILTYKTTRHCLLMPGTNGCAGRDERPSSLVSVSPTLVDKQWPGTEGQSLV